jgi:hypothetical protein
MFGPQKAQPGKCNAELHIGGDWEGRATMLCQLDPGHEGRHQEVFYEKRARVEWKGDDRKKHVRRGR